MTRNSERIAASHANRDAEKLFARPVYQNMAVRYVNTTTKMFAIMQRMLDARPTRV
jgi:hypothetical protein